MKALKKLMILTLISALSFVSAEEEKVRNLTLDEAVSLATVNNTSINKAKLSLNSLKNTNKYSWNSVSPTASIKGTWTDDIEGDYTSVGISGTVNIALSTNLYSSIQKAKLNYQNGLISYEQTVRQIERDVRKSFYNLLYLQENLKLQKRSLETSYTTYTNNQEKFQKGQISELDVLSSRVNYQQKKPEVEKAESNLKNYFSSFKQIIGIEQEEEIQLDGSLESILKTKTISHDSLPESYINAPDISKAELNVKLEENAVLAERFSAYAPSITGSLQVGKSKRSTVDEWTTTNNLSVGVTIPLDGWLPWSTKAVSIKNAINSLKASELNLENTKTDILVQTESCLRKINTSITQIESLKANVTLANETYEMTKTAYNYGKTSLLNLQNANNSVLSANVSLKSEAYNLISAILDLEYLLGLPYETL